MYQLAYTLFIIGSSDRQNPASGIPLTSTLVVPLQVIIAQTSAPYFVAPLKNVQMVCGDILPMTLPKMYDPDYEDVGSIASIDWGGAGTFITGKYPSFTLQPKDNTTEVGKFTVTFNLKDNNP